MVGTLESARARLVGLLDRTARRKAPQKAAYAQGRLDCWLEQQEENHQPTHIADCRAEFEQAIAELEAAMQPEPVMEEEPEPEPQAEPMAPQDFIVYFGFDSARLTDQAKSVLDNAVKQAKKMQDMQVVISAHTDTAGPDAYNERLSMRRAVAVKNYMTARGIDAGRIGIDSRGETRPAVKTGNNVREGANRRVEITLL
jgi:OOP family OmpA-OmpF porin